MMTPDYWKYQKACKIVHKFSMDVITKRRAVLEEKKVSLFIITIIINNDVMMMSSIIVSERRCAQRDKTKVSGLH